MTDPIQIHTIQMTPRIFAEQVAVCWLSAPKHSEEEQLLDTALERACARIGITSEEIVEEISRSFTVLEVVETVPQLTTPGGVG
jgi:hypothetical protein